MLELLRNLAPHNSHLRQPRHNDLGKSSPPPAPDYAGAATATAAGNLDAARVASKANRVSQYTPYGSLIYTNNQNGDQDQWRSDVTLAPDQQQMLNQQNQISLGLGDTMNQGLGYVQNMLDTPLDTSGFTNVDPASVAGREQVTATLLERMQPSLDRARQRKENDLLIQGHNRGGEAWDATQDDLSRSENDQRMAAVLAGGTEQSRLLGAQQAQRQNQLAETQTVRNEPLATLNAVRTGAMPTNPQFTNVPQQQTTQGPNLLQAAGMQGQSDMNAYNADQAGSQNMMNGLFSLGGKLGSAYLMAGSERDIKQEISRIGTHSTGIGVYSFEYKPEYRDTWGHGKKVGVMADEVELVMPEAVMLHPDGYRMVDYGMLNHG